VTVVAVTGARGFRKGEEEIARGIVRKTLEGLQGVTEFRTGAAFGVDTVACEVGLNSFKKAWHRLYVPDQPHNADVVEMFDLWRDARRADIIRMPKGSSYRDRNIAMVEGAEMVCAFPSTGEEIVRSGTWMTVRLARRAGVPLLVVPLSGEKGWVENGAERVHA